MPGRHRKGCAALASDLTQYYAARANEYEQVYLKPERRQDIVRLQTRLRDLLAGHKVLEVACGTGYWTATLADIATSIVATDINDQVLRLAQAKHLPNGKAQFVRADAFSLPVVHDAFTAGFAGFWWSHVHKANLPHFLAVLHAKLLPGARVVFIDNLYVKGSSHPITRVDADGNTYQQRRLENGMHYEVLKNFPDEAELRDVVGRQACTIQYERMRYYWVLCYTLR